MRTLICRIGIMLVVILTAVKMTVTGANAQSTSGTVGDVAERLTTQLGNIGKLAVAGGAVIGIVMIATGLLKLKAAAESQSGGAKYVEGIWRVTVGAALLAIPAFTGILQSTFDLGTGASISEGGGQSF